MKRLNSNGLKLQPCLTPFLYRNLSDVSELRATLEEVDCTYSEECLA